MINEEFDETFYGKWVGRIADWRLINPGVHQANLEEAKAYWQEERRRRDQHRGEVIDLVQQLEAIDQAQSPQGRGAPPTNGAHKQGSVRGDEHQEPEEQMETGIAVESETTEAKAARKGGKVPSAKARENEDVWAKMGKQNITRNENQEKRKGRPTSTAAAAASAGTREEEKKVKTRSSSLGKC